MASVAIYSLASIPLALHYLSMDQFGLWALVTQIGSYLLLIDLGMSGSVSRILIDHKDTKSDGIYGAVLQTGAFVLLVQGLCIALVGILLAWWLPAIIEVPAHFVSTFRILTAGQCILLGIFFVGRVFTHMLQAHQRYDIINYSQIGQLGVNLAVQWLAFHRGLGLYSLLIAGAVGSLFGLAMTAAPSILLGLLPPKGSWGRPTYPLFKNIFAYGNDLFMLVIGYQLLTASQIIIITRTLGLPFAADWSIATRTFTLAQQVVGRIFDFSSSALGEMFVRNEQTRLEQRFRELFVLTAAASIFVSVSVAVCNGSFVTILTKGRVSWPPGNDILLALLLVLGCLVRCHIGLMGVTKQIGGMRYIYFLEGIVFVLGAIAGAHFIGMPGILVAALLANVAFSGSYGTRRTARYFGVSTRQIAFQWLQAPLKFLLILAPLGAGLWFGTIMLPPLVRLLLNSAVMGLAGLGLLWRVGLPESFRQELKAAFGRLRSSQELVSTPTP